MALTYVPYRPLLLWLLMITVQLFGVYLSWDLGILQKIIDQDATRVCLLTLGLLLGMSLHCAYRVIFLSAQEKKSEALMQHKNLNDKALFGPGESIAQDYIVASQGTHFGPESEKSLSADIMVEKLRGGHQVGWFVVNLMIKLGLMGTVIGFIIMLSSVSGLDSLTLSDVKALMQTMTQGMGIAMSTTLIGLISSMFLSAQYLFLDRIADQLVVRIVDFQQQRQAHVEHPLRELAA